MRDLLYKSRSTKKSSEAEGNEYLLGARCDAAEREHVVSCAGGRPMTTAIEVRTAEEVTEAATKTAVARWSRPASLVPRRTGKRRPDAWGDRAGGALRWAWVGMEAEGTWNDHVTLRQIKSTKMIILQRHWEALRSIPNHYKRSQYSRLTTPLVLN